jgi:hypothetical protein
MLGRRVVNDILSRRGLEKDFCGLKTVVHGVHLDVRKVHSEVDDILWIMTRKWEYRKPKVGRRTIVSSDSELRCAHKSSGCNRVIVDCVTEEWIIT